MAIEASINNKEAVRLLVIIDDLSIEKWRI